MITAMVVSIGPNELFAIAENNRDSDATANIPINPYTKAPIKRHRRSVSGMMLMAEKITIKSPFPNNSIPKPKLEMANKNIKIKV